MKIYTKAGDQGQTCLLGQSKTSKSNLRLHAYGEIDELNALLGVVQARTRVVQVQNHLGDWGEDLAFEIKNIQNHLFTFGSHLACVDPQFQKQLPHLKEDFVTWLEELIDRQERDLPELKNFILPGGHELASLLHLCRTTCRRIERSVVHLSEKDEVSPLIIQSLNRLSDYFFSKARFCNLKMGFNDEIWEKP